MAAQLRVCGFRSLGRLLANDVTLCSSRPLLGNRAIPVTLQTPPWSSCVQRTFCSENNNRGFPPQREIKKFGVTITRGPIAWFSTNIRLWLLKRFFDPEFDEREFLRGAKQALCVISSLVGKNRLDDLTGLVADESIEDIKTHGIDEAVGKSFRQAIETKDIISATIKTVGLGYVEDGSSGKSMDIEVCFVCTPDGEGFNERSLGNVTIIRMSEPRVIHFTFTKVVYPDSVSEWQVWL